MHETGIANSILGRARKVLHRYPGQRLSKIGLRVGEFADIDCDSLRSCFEAVVKNENLDPLTLEIESCRVAQKWRGDELEIAYLELEDAMETMEAKA
jgi:Zn finger protein HypA/HybF involved in hydrogenase expression